MGMKFEEGLLVVREVYGWDFVICDVDWVCEWQKGVEAAAQHVQILPPFSSSYLLSFMYYSLSFFLDLLFTTRDCKENFL